MYREAVAMLEKVLAPQHRLIASTTHRLAAVLRIERKYEEAETLFQRALSMREALLGRDHPEVSQTLNSMGVLYSQAGRYSEAEQCYQRALAIREKVPWSPAPSGRDDAQKPRNPVSEGKEIRRCRGLLPPIAHDPRNGAGPGPRRGGGHTYNLCQLPPSAQPNGGGSYYGGTGTRDRSQGSRKKDLIEGVGAGAVPVESSFWIRAGEQSVRLMGITKGSNGVSSAFLISFPSSECILADFSFMGTLRT